MNPRLFSALALFMTAASAWGQARQVAIRTLCLEHSGAVSEVSLPGGKPDEAPREVTLLTAGPSEVIEATFPGNEAVFLLKGSTPDKPVVAARGALASSKRQLLLFLPRAGGEGKPYYEIRAFDDDTSDFKMGSIRAINLAPVPVRFAIAGGVTPQIPPNKHAIFPHPKKVDDYNMYPAKVEFLSANGKWHESYSASWKASDRRREIVVALIDMKFKQPAVKVYSDFPQWLDEAATAGGAP